ncbi:RNA 2',3'-cyclic phosphodiesterase [Tessaracoccus oleiagri]|uniref:RNA 2',3'-cyclic phosphodiesterase n=1 Tax=Tessaracoccus oleiagri TaxID=686624 RepID=A0A1G9JGR7_9ACTN|nr:RNA 2',3'-cyclic phosphodiesterase [Tessaracoccus oleiagri]SDL36769.1 2'-5' RNA ligase [Tessaracoccus oleiagri]
MGDRMFAAVLPPQEMVEELDALLAPRRDSDPRLRWTRPDGWHLTTAFMADVPDVERLEETLAEAAATVSPFRIRVASGRVFPHPVAARILSLGVTHGDEEIAALAEKCRHAANRAGAAPDGARFVPHLTLARANRGIQATKWLGVLDSFPGWSFDVDEVALVQSHQVGKQYDVVARFKLGEQVP